MPKFKVGDIVYLIIGSPAMSVKETGCIDNNPNECLALCNWFEGNKVFEQEFNETQLTLDKPKDNTKH